MFTLTSDIACSLHVFTYCYICDHCYTKYVLNASCTVASCNYTCVLVSFRVALTLLSYFYIYTLDVYSYFLLYARSCTSQRRLCIFYYCTCCNAVAHCDYTSAFMSFDCSYKICACAFYNWCCNEWTSSMCDVFMLSCKFLFFSFTPYYYYLNYYGSNYYFVWSLIVYVSLLQLLTSSTSLLFAFYTLCRSRSVDLINW